MITRGNRSAYKLLLVMVKKSSYQVHGTISKYYWNCFQRKQFLLNSVTVLKVSIYELFTYLVWCQMSLGQMLCSCGRTDGHWEQHWNHTDANVWQYGGLYIKVFANFAFQNPFIIWLINNNSWNPSFLQNPQKCVPKSRDMTLF